MPSAFLINMDECISRGCSKCKDACDKQCIDFNMSDEVIRERAGTIVVATGLEPYDPRAKDVYGYTRSENKDTGHGQHGSLRRLRHLRG